MNSIHKLRVRKLLLKQKSILIIAKINQFRKCELYFEIVKDMITYLLVKTLNILELDDQQVTCIEDKKFQLVT